MRKKIGIFAIAAVIGALVLSGSAVAFAAGGDEAPVEEGESYGYGRGPWTDTVRDEDGDGIPNGQDEDYQCPEDGSNSPWVLGDERLERFQERFDLSNEQMTQLQEKVQSMIEEGADRVEIGNVIRSQLESWGIESPELMGEGPHGPNAGGQGFGRNSGEIPDEDGDGVPNGQDEDYERPEDCTGWGRR
ncbi:hypothetical protein AKJ54_00925 [candidate division MSBL1 archaeon SCGC-AAA382K21]|uniref:Uncharacterized protein n=1 Tax=candidate division MSBL1 archaeon SCGC-AAA382K21 TaxID=1698283 RepID=A0A133VKG7_9EURY|nr:hypothetical protein AKJ54_00925 [candidate division MSBL1 archaeon SCGC-AAA382K21]